MAFVSLDVLDPKPARQLLCSRSQHRFDDTILDQICEAVGRLPLALEALAIRLAELSDRLADPQQAPHELLADLRRASTPVQLEAFQRAAGTAVTRAEGVFGALSGALGELGNDRKRLSSLAYVADSPLPVALFSLLVGADDDADLNLLMDACMKRGLARASSGVVLIHALTTAAIGASNGPGEERDALLRALTRLMSINTNDPVAIRSEIAHYERMHVCFQSALGAEDSSVLAFATSLAIAYGAVGRNEDALRLGEETLAILERVQGPEHPDTLASRTNLAIAYAAVGRNDDALRLGEETVAIRERVQGPEHPNTLASRNNLAGAYLAVGRYDEALRLDEETLAIRERVLGPQHPDTLTSRKNLEVAKVSSSERPSQSEPVAFLEWLSGIVAGSGGLVLTLLFAMRMESQSFWLSAPLLALILVASLGVTVGAHQHGSRARRSFLLMLWVSTALAIAAAVLSALSLVLVVFALLVLATALLGTWRQVRARALAEPGS